jgi:hypothetical protein
MDKAPSVNDHSRFPGIIRLGSKQPHTSQGQADQQDNDTGYGEWKQLDRRSDRMSVIRAFQTDNPAIRNGGLNLSPLRL